VACGLPVVAFADAALHGVIEDGVNGFIVETDECFIERLHHILQDDNLYHSMQRAASAQIQPYSVETAALRLLLGYQHVVRAAHVDASTKRKLSSYFN
jgi:glycosyltransferase involved in cell wall biosynthesis